MVPASSGAQVNVTPVAVSGQQAAGAEPGVRYKSFQDPMLGADGTVTFVASLNGAATNADSGLWMGGPGNLRPVAREGQAASGLPQGVRYDDFTFNFNPLMVNAQDQVVFNGSVTGGGLFGRAIWAGSPQDPQLVARDAANTADSTNGESYLFLRVADLNDTGRVAFASAINVPGDTRRTEGIWTGPPGGLSRAARSADPAAGTSEKFIAFGEPKLSNAGQTFLPPASST